MKKKIKHAYKGIGVGDGWIDGSIQSQSYDNIYYAAGLISQGTK